MVQHLKNPLLDPVHLARIEDLALLARVVVEGNFFGVHRSRRQGQGNEFFQYRNYERGEDLKNVDWKVFAKRSELVTKTYQESTNANLIIVLDASASMGYHGEGSYCPKFRYAQMLAACLGYLAYNQGDRVGLFGGTANSLEWMFPTGGKENFKNVLTSIGRMKAQGKDAGDKAWQKFKSKLPLQATVVVVSDFWEEEEKLANRLSFAQSSRYDCLCLQILDPLEENLPQEDAVRFIELEGEREVSVSPERIRSDYQTKIKQHQANLKIIMAGVGAEFCTLRTSDDLGHGIRKFLGMRGSVK